MPGGIIVFGASGAGTTTIGKALALKLDYTHFDLDDYFWQDTKIPFSLPRPHNERIEKLLADLEKCQNFVISGSFCGWDSPFIPFLNLAVFVTADTKLRIKRLKERESALFGGRILPGGDMFKNHTGFIEWAAQYDTMQPPERCLKLHQEWARSLPCAVITIDGSKEVSANILKIIEQSKTVHKILTSR